MSEGRIRSPLNMHMHHFIFGRGTEKVQNRSEQPFDNQRKECDGEDRISSSHRGHRKAFVIQMK